MKPINQYNSVKWTKSPIWGVPVSAALLILAVASGPRGAFAAGSDFCSTAVAVTSVPFSDSTNSTTFGNSGDPTVCYSTGGNPRYNSFWYQFTAPADGLYGVSTTGSSNDTIVAVYKATTASCGGLGISQLRACEDDQYLTNEAGDSFYASAGEQFLVQVYSYFSGGGAAILVQIDYGHETMVLQPKNVKVKIPKGATSATKTISFSVLNPSTDASGHAVQVSRSSVGPLNESPCSAVLGSIDVDPKTLGFQDTITLAAGKKATAKFDVTFSADQVLTTNAKIPVRCSQSVTVSTAGTALPQADRSNDTAYIIYEIIDQNDL